MPLPKKCPICFSSSEELSVVTSHVNGNDDQSKRAFFNCDNCGIIFLHPRYTTLENNKFYEEEFETFMHSRDRGDSGWLDINAHVERNRKTVRRRLGYLEEHMEGKLKVLEIGCSSGFMLKELTERGHTCVGIEPSKKFREGLIEQGFEVYSDLEELSSSGGAGFDLILHFFVLEHVLDPKSFIQLLVGQLKFGGKMVFEIPCSQDALYKLYDIPEFERFYWSKAHPWYFNKQSIRYLLQEIGLDYKLTEEQRYGFSNHFQWALKRCPGGELFYSRFIGEDFEQLYRELLISKGYADTLIVEVSR